MEWDAVAYWKTWHSDDGAHFRHCVVEPDAAQILPQGDLGHFTRDGAGCRCQACRTPTRKKDPNKRSAMERASPYMGLEPGKP